MGSVFHIAGRVYSRCGYSTCLKHNNGAMSPSTMSSSHMDCSCLNQELNGYRDQ